MEKNLNSILVFSEKRSGKLLVTVVVSIIQGLFIVLNCIVLLQLRVKMG